MMIYITPAQLISIKKKLVLLEIKKIQKQIHSKMFKIQNVHPEFNLFIKIKNNQWSTMYIISYIQQIILHISKYPFLAIFWHKC